MRTGFWRLVWCALLFGVLMMGSSSLAEAQSWSNGYAFRAAITVDHTKVPNTDQVNFPLLVSGTYSFLAATANGGGVTNSNGYDIIFTSDSAGTSALPFEQEAYSASAGKIIYWVQLPNLSHTADTVIYMFYGNASVSTDQSNKTAVWDTNYVGVWHLPNGTTLSANDSTSNANNGTNHSATATTGQIGGAASFSGSQSVSIGANSGLQPANITLSFWMNRGSASQTNYARILEKGTDSTGAPYGSYFGQFAGTDSTAFFIGLGFTDNTNDGWTTPTGSLTANTWYYITLAYDGSTITVYENGVQKYAHANTRTIKYDSTPLTLGADNTNSGGFQEYLSGELDEVRLSKVARSGDWIAAEYNNQSSPSTFFQLAPSNPPTIASLSPAIGPSGTSVTIAGSNFGGTQGTSTVALAGTICTVSSWTSTSIVMIVPNGAITGNVVVTVAGVASTGVSFTVPATWSNGYAFRRAITIDHTKVPNTDQANFPLLISGTYSFLAGAANGGDVTNSNGYDIIFTSDAAGTNTLPFEQESYSASSGAVNYWVEVPTLSHTTDTVIYMFYGNPSIGTDQSNRTAVWDTHFIGVWHLTNNIYLTATDSTSNGNNGAIGSGTSATGKIVGGESFSGSGGITVTPSGSLSGSFTVEEWASPSTTSGTLGLFGSRSPSDSSFDAKLTGGTVHSDIGNGSSWLNTSANATFPYAANVWHHFVYTVSSSGYAIFVDGSQIGTGILSGTPLLYDTNHKLQLGATGYSGEGFAGVIDEARVSNVVRSADWIATEYVNENNPTGFYAVGSATVNGMSGLTAPYVEAISPTSGPATVLVTILGANFGSAQGTSTVTFNGLAATPSVWTSTSIQVPVPIGATTGNVIVTVSGVASNTVTFTVTPPPTSGYAFQRAITIAHTKVPNTDQPNFPLLVSGTYPFLATSINGGDVTNPSGYDIVFTSDAYGANLLPFEQDSYSAATGAIDYWVKVPNLSHTTDTVIYMFYGNGAVSSDQSNKAAVWDASYKGVWHLGSGSVLSTRDSTGNANNGSVNGTVTAATGIISGAAYTPGGSNSGISMGSSITADNSPFTYSFWMNSSGGGTTIQRGQDGFGNGWSASVWFNSNAHFSIVNSSPSQITLNSNATFTNNTWYNVAAVWTPGTGMQLYVNGALDTSNTNNSTLLRSSTKPLQFLSDNTNNTFNGVLDEVQISNVPRSGDWIATEYANQSSPLTFYSVGSSLAIGSGGTHAPYIAGSWPASGPVTTPMTILGENFGATQGASTVTFNGTPGTPSLWSDSSIFIPVPTTASSGNVVVTVSGAASNPATFTVTTNPGAWSTSPTSGMVGLQVVISGINFGSTQGSSTVTLSGVNCPVLSWANSSITVLVPTGATSGPFVVTVGGQTASSPVFTVTNVPTGWLDQDIGTVGVSGSASFNSGTFTIKASGADIYNSADGFHFVYQPLNGDGTLVARVVSVQNGGTYAKAGVMIRETLAAGSTNAYSTVQGTNTILFDWRATTGAGTSQSSANGSIPYWVKVVRSGNSFSGYASLDGMNWSQVGATETITMAQSVYIGLAVTSENNSALATATIDSVSLAASQSLPPSITSVSATTGSVGNQVVIGGQNFGASQGSSLVLLNDTPATVSSWGATSITINVPTGATTGPLVVSVAPSMNDSNPVQFTVTSTPLPTGWLDQDVGAVGVLGSASYSNGTFTLNGAGSGTLGRTSDGMHFVYQPLSGDGTIVAKVVQGGGSEAGVMIRETLNPGASDADMLFFAGANQNNPPGGFNFVQRTSTGAQSAGYSNVESGNVGNQPAPYWIKVNRSGSTFTGYASPDGVYWTQVGTSQTISMATNVYVGLFVSSRSTSGLTTATFNDVSLDTPSVPAPVINSVSATTGYVGTQVVIYGVNFGNVQGVGTVFLNNLPTTINSWSSTSITMTVPNGATSGSLVVSVDPSMNDSNPAQFTVTSNPLPTGWLDQDVGPTGVTGSASYSNGTFTLNGAGSGTLGRTSDGMHFVYQTLSGDGTIIARVVQGGGSEAGAMIRETLNPGASDADMIFFAGANQDNPPGGFNFVQRTSTGAQSAGYSNVESGNVGNQPAPYWIKVTRSGSTFTGYASPDGIYWTQVGTSQTITMATNVDVGLFVSNRSTTSLTTATFDSVSLSSGTPGNAPVVTSASPTTAGPGYSVTIAGSGFGAAQGSSQAYFNGAAASAITSWSDSQIVATVPTTASTGPVTAVVNGLGSNRTVSITIYKPIISSLTPPAASPGGTITIAGSGFGASQNSSTVQFNGVNASVSSWSDTSISASVPSSATTGPVTVTEGGILSGGVSFTVLEPLTVSSVSPNSGSAGTPITINGGGFGSTQSNSTVDFYGSPATITSWSDAQIVALVPTGAPSGSVDVTVAGQTAFGPSFLVNSIPGVTDSQGNLTRYTMALIGGMWVPLNSQGSGCSSCTLRGTIEFTYDTAGNVLTRTNENGVAAIYTNDSNNNVLSTSVPIGNGTNAVTSYTYNGFGEVLTATDPLGNVTTNTYDTNGNLTKVTTPAPNGSTAASSTAFAYNSLGELTSITDPLNNVTALTYTSAGLIQTITDAQNNVTTYGYDAHGNRTSVTDALNHTTSFTYDSGDRLTKITYPDTTTTQFGYDYRGRRTSVTDQNGKVTTYAYDDADRLTSVTDAANNVTAYAYDSENNLTGITDANNHTTNFGYDAFGRVTQTTFPSSAVETYTYDALGNLTGKTDRKNQSINYTYDQLNRLTQKTYPDNSTVNYTYDNDSRLTQVSDPTGTYSFTFDNMGRLTGTTTQYAFLTSRTFATAYSYDAASNRIGFTDPEGGSTNYAYDTLNRLQTLTPPAAISGGSFGFGYDALSRRTSLTRPNAVNTTYSYDNLSRLLSVLHQTGTSTLDGAAYTLDNAGNRTAKTDQRTAVATSYGYDSIYQLLSATQGGSTTESYTYDPVGNRTASLGVASYTTNSSNELTGNSNASFTYDYNGNETSKTDSTGTTNYTWDFENRLTSVTLPGSGGTVQFSYDPFGRRIKKISSAGTSIYAYDGDNLIEETNSSGAAVARYQQGLNIDEPLAMLRSSVTSFYEQDGLGSVTSLSNRAGALAQTYAFDSFGKQTASSGSLTNPLQYTGREFDSETGLYYYRARYYDPSAGRFLSEDPAGFVSGIDFYSYVGNNPTNMVDPIGLQGGPWHPPAGVHTKCTPADDCQTIKGKMWLLRRMIASHTGWDRAMPRPRGGNKHAQDIADLWKQLANCFDIYLTKCKDCDPPEPKFPPVPIPIVGPLLDKITDPMLEWLQDIIDDVKHIYPPKLRPGAPVPVPVPIPIPVPI